MISSLAGLAALVVAAQAAVPAELFNQELYTKLLSTSSASDSLWPEYTSDLGESWTTFTATEWTAAFLPSTLYLLNERHTQLCPSTTPTASNGSTTDWLTLARTWSEGLYVPDEALNNTHDVGFLSWPAQFELLLDSSNETAATAVLDMANHLADRFSSIVGCTKSWDNGGVDDFQVIIDNMMNLQLLVLAASRTGNSTYLDMATSHANKTIVNHIRADGTSFHVVDYDPTTGDVAWRGTAQGYSNSSTWSRGQAWGVYGFALMYNATGIQSYLDTSRTMASWYIANLPSFGVAYWDFNAPLPTELDTSASTIISSALLVLSSIEMRLGNTSGATHWNTAAVTLLSNLVTEAITPWDGVSILGNGTVNNRATPPNNNTGIVYGDHFWVAAGNQLLSLGLANCTDGTPAVGALKSSSLSSSASGTTTGSAASSSSTASPKSAGAASVRVPYWRYRGGKVEL